MKIISNLAMGALGAGIALFGLSLASSHSATAVATAPTDQEAFVNAAESTINGVVSVINYVTPKANSMHGRSQGGGYNPFFDDPFFEYFFGGAPQQRQQPQQPQQQQERPQGSGSGVILSKDGYIVTNNHVINGADRIEVVLNDNRSFEASVIGADPDTDLALIKIESPDDLHVIPMGNSDDLRVGEWVLAVGNPFGFTSTVTSGIVSAKARNISESSRMRERGNNIESYIQTDAALNPGNSGGALVNLDGELVGVNAAIYSQTGTYAGCSFAIPTSIVKKVVADLKEYGTVQKAQLGILFAPVTPELVKEKDLKGVNAGIYVQEVMDRSAAKLGGIEPGDVIVSINDNPTNNIAQVQGVIAKFSPGDKVNVLLYRDGKKLNKEITLLNPNGNTKITRDSSADDLGAAFAKLSDSELNDLGIRHGVKITELKNGPLKSAGLREGYVIMSINDYAINSADDIKKLYKAVMENPSVDKVFYVKAITPQGKTFFTAVPLLDE